MQRVLFESYYNDNFGSSVDRTNIYRWDQILHKNWSHGTKIVAENIGPRTNFWWDQNFSDRAIVRRSNEHVFLIHTTRTPNRMETGTRIILQKELRFHLESPDSQR